MKTKSIMRKFLIGIFFSIMFVLTFLNIQTQSIPIASTAFEVYCWHCSTDICGNVGNRLCCWSSYGGMKNNCQIPN